MSIRNKRPESKFYARAQISLAFDKIDETVENLEWLVGLMESLGIADDKPADGQSFREKVEAMKTAIRPTSSKDFGDSLFAAIVHLDEELTYASEFGEGLYTEILPPSEWEGKN